LSDEDRVISGILLKENVVDVAQEKQLVGHVEDLSNEITILEATLKLKRDELKKVNEKRNLFLIDKKEKEERISFIHSLIAKRELYVATQPQQMEEDDKNLHQRLLNLHEVEVTPDL
jgi:hypothetical protein